MSYTRKYRAGDGFIAFLLVAVLIIVMLVSKIRFWMAFFVGLAISVIRGLFKAA